MRIATARSRAQAGADAVGAAQDRRPASAAAEEADTRGRASAVDEAVAAQVETEAAEEVHAADTRIEAAAVALRVAEAVGAERAAAIRRLLRPAANDARIVDSTYCYAHCGGILLPKPSPPIHARDCFRISMSAAAQR
jgi:hypothetical protein